MPKIEVQVEHRLSDRDGDELPDDRDPTQDDQRPQANPVPARFGIERV